MTRAIPLLLLFLLSSPLAHAVQQYGYRVLDKKPQQRELYVQGLQILDGKLYLSAGEYGKSRVQRYDFDSGELETEFHIDPRLWGEGLTVLGDRLYLLTWKSRNLFVYSRDDLKGVARMQLPGQGWGMTTDGKQLIYSDGSDRLFYLSPEEHRITRAVRVTEDGKPVVRLNELEWIDGKVWANVWQTNRIVIIDPATGRVEGDINLQGLLPVMERRPDTDVLNGIARNPADAGIWVTGKRWPWMYRIELVPIDPDDKTP
jgi:glutamine cyclotransferase